MATLTSDSRPIIGRGPPLGARFFFLSVVSIAAMVVDNRGPQLEKSAICPWTAAVYDIVWPDCEVQDRFAV